MIKSSLQRAHYSVFRERAAQVYEVVDVGAGRRARARCRWGRAAARRARAAPAAAPPSCFCKSSLTEIVLRNPHRQLPQSEVVNGCLP